jgi:hypothetical protein
VKPIPHAGLQEPPDEEPPDDVPPPDEAVADDDDPPPEDALEPSADASLEALVVVPPQCTERIAAARTAIDR